MLHRATYIQHKSLIPNIYDSFYHWYGCFPNPQHNSYCCLFDAVYPYPMQISLL